MSSSPFNTTVPLNTERVSQAVLDIDVHNTDGGFDNVRELLLAWLKKKVGENLPLAMSLGKTDQIDSVHALRTETVGLSDPLFWSFRRNDHDATYPQRTWVTECSLARAGDRLRLGYRLHLINRGSPAPFERSIPKFIRDIGERYNVFIDNREVDFTAFHVEFEEDVEQMIALITSSNRKIPVICLSSYVDEANNERISISGDRIARHLFGTAHVYTMSCAMSFVLSSKLGKEFSVYQGAIRIWPTDQHRESGANFAGHLYLRQTVVDDGVEKTLREIIARVLALSAQRRDAEQAIPSFSAVRQVASELAREQALHSGQAAVDLVPLYEEDNKRLGERIIELKSEYDYLLQVNDQELNEILVERDEYRAEIQTLYNRLSVIQAMLNHKTQDPNVLIPDSLEEIENWAGEYLKNSMILAPRAIRAARRSHFENITLVYQTLLLLQNAYVPMRQEGRPEDRLSWENGLQQLGLTLAPSFSANNAGKFGDEYFIDWNGRRRELEWHLKGSNSRDPRYRFRLYFFWCEEDQAVVVGSLPSHLTNRIS